MKQLFLRSYLVRLLQCRFLFPSRKSLKCALKEGESMFSIDVFTQLGRPCAYVTVHPDSRPTQEKCEARAGEHCYCYAVDVSGA